MTDPRFPVAARVIKPDGKPGDVVELIGSEYRMIRDDKTRKRYPYHVRELQHESPLFGTGTT